MRCKDVYNRVHNVDLENVIYFYAEGNVIYIKTFKVDQEVLDDVNLEILSERLRDEGFLRINKSVVVNLQHVLRTIVYSNYRFKLVLSNKEKVTVNRSYRKKYTNYMKVKKR